MLMAGVRPPGALVAPIQAPVPRPFQAIPVRQALLQAQGRAGVASDVPAAPRGRVPVQVPVTLLVPP